MCIRDSTYPGTCVDQLSSSDWLFGLWPGPPRRFEPTGTDTDYQEARADYWPGWGSLDLAIGDSSGCLLYTSPSPRDA